MQAFFAIVQDTWRQSKQQWVFLILLVMLAMVTGVFALGTRVHEYGDGADSKHSQTLVWRWQEDTESFSREDGWEGLYADMIRRQQKSDDKLVEAEKEVKDLQDKARAINDEYNAAIKRRAPQKELDEINARAKPIMLAYQEKAEAKDKLRKELNDELRAEVKRRTSEISDLQKALESTLMVICRFLTWLAMLGFIAAASGYFPGLIAQGSIDSVLSRPVSRLQVFGGKFVGGLAMVTLALFACWTITFVSFGWVSGIWHWRFFSAFPIAVLSFALLYSIVAWVGLMTRSTPLAMVTGYFFYLVIDPAVGFLVKEAAVDPLFAEWTWLVKTAEFVKMTFPNFTLMRASAEASICNVPIFEWQPILVAFVWLGVLLFTSYSRFRRTDF